MPIVKVPHFYALPDGSERFAAAGSVVDEVPAGREAFFDGYVPPEVVATTDPEPAPVTEGDSDDNDPTDPDPADGDGDNPGADDDQAAAAPRVRTGRRRS